MPTYNNVGYISIPGKDGESGHRLLIFNIIRVNQLIKINKKVKSDYFKITREIDKDNKLFRYMLEFTGNYSFTTGTEVCIQNFISFHRLRVFRPNPTLQKMINNLFTFFGTVGMYR